MILVPLIAPPNILALTVQLLNSFPTLICTSTGSPATNVTWTRDGQPLTIDGSTYRMVQTVANRNNSTYENVLTINQTLASTVGSTFICGVSNVIGSDTSDSLQITGRSSLREWLRLIYLYPAFYNLVYLHVYV